MLNEILRLLRVLNDLKSIELAKMLSVSPSYVSEIEAGKKKPTLELIQKYAQAFKTTPATLLFFAESMEREKQGDNFRSVLRAKALRFLQMIENAGIQQDLFHQPQSTVSTTE